MQDVVFIPCNDGTLVPPDCATHVKLKKNGCSGQLGQHIYKAYHLQSIKMMWHLLEQIDPTGHRIYHNRKMASTAG